MRDMGDLSVIVQAVDGFSTPDEELIQVAASAPVRYMSSDFSVTQQRLNDRFSDHAMSLNDPQPPSPT